MAAPVLLGCQDSALIAGRQHILDGRRRIIIVLPTGGGKTVVAAAIIHSARKNFNSKILFVAHRIELIDQCVEQLAKWGITEVGVIRSDDKRYAPLMPVQVASIQTLARRELWFTPNIVFVDECHRAAADSYLEHIFEAFPEAIHFGLTATPIRADGKPLGRAYGGPYDALEVAAQYSDLLAVKFISEPRCFSSPPVHMPDLSAVHTVAGDYNLEELEAVMMGEALVGGIFERWKELYDLDGVKRKTVIFATSIKHSHEIVKLFFEKGVHAAHLDGETPLQVRRSLLERFEHGDLDVVCNVGVLEEGWDCPPAKCGVLARPTKSLRLYMQQVGRFLRPWNNVVPLILDHAGNFDRHQAPHIDRTWKLDEPTKKAKTAGDFKVCPSCYAYIPAHLRECPHCNRSFAKEIEEQERLREVKVPLVERVEAVDPKRRDFDKWVDEARRKGYKPTWASVQYKEKYGSWPPWGWSQWAKAAHEADEQWKAKLARNAIWRERARIERETSTEDKLIALADAAFKEWDPVDVALMSPEERAQIQAQLDAAKAESEAQQEIAGNPIPDDEEVPF